MKYFNFFRSKGFNYSDEVLTNFALSLKTKPFVILSGISGSGKSKIAQIFSEFLVDDLSKQFAFMSVKPNWKDSKDLLGYHNIITDEYETTPFLNLLIRAAKEPDKPFFLLLDEMNLAKVEHYFSDFLSCIESRNYIEQTTTTATTEEEVITRLNSLYTDRPTVSEAIVLSAFDLKEKGYSVHTQFYLIEEYRNNRFSQWWYNSFSSSKNWTAQYRSEFNQGDNRLANRLFESPSGGKVYRLKQESELRGTELTRYKEIEEKYFQLTKANTLTNKVITQEPMILHSKVNSLPSTDSAYPSKIINNVSTAADWYDDATNTYFIPSKLEIPVNIFVVGTVNIDETTYMFSPKVLDRANLIEFNDVDISSIFDTPSTTTGQPFKLQNDPILLPLELATLQLSQGLATSNPDVMNDLLEIFKLLEKYNLHFGYRVINEVSLYITNALKDVTTYQNLAGDALDFQLLQKVLPKFNGSIQKLWDPFVEILSYIRISNATPLQAEQLNSMTTQLFNKELVKVTNADYTSVFKYPRTAKKLLILLRNLENYGFTSFIE
ncbi:AAA family ATPase [Peribacillus sp. ACCC06369]|uniref:AAA family ATPase n=1 Tax=Peribacillus sp. ACCC06369 TaxID=3055860 RepID=UPI0025A04B87|nr:AAA family ATPase [Peribacillus sp. ACCC06369]MDM5360421.1 AAA family ATPase [Peribacillus sp. ACCC06369]